jgi:hypothetical protein
LDTSKSLRDSESVVPYIAANDEDEPYSPRSFLWFTMPLIHERKYYEHAHERLDNLMDNVIS